jgi:hypothetical protein
VKLIPYKTGVTYRFRLVVNVPNHTYDIFITPAGGTEQRFGTNFAFRAQQRQVISLSNWALIGRTDSHTVCKVTISPSKTLTLLTEIDYFALGDSVASGHGLRDDGKACRRSDKAYPYQVVSLPYRKFVRIRQQV